jgi:hypothetical protein
MDIPAHRHTHPHMDAHLNTHTHTNTQEDANSIASLNMKAARAPKPPTVQLFDVLPIKGVLRPGEVLGAT